VPERLTAELARFHAEVAAVTDAAALYELQVRYLGKKGSVTQLRGVVAQLDPEARRAYGQAFNAAKDEIEAVIAERRRQLEQAERERDLLRHEDLTTGAAEGPVGSLHPITQTRRELARIFRRLGFDAVDGPHVESQRFNFDMLNIAAGHPARDMQDTFFVEGPPGGRDPELVLRTHTSPVQIRTMLLHPPPVRIVALGTVFRRDDDATHSPMFNQIEGLCIDRGVTMADLKATLYRFVELFFGRRLQVRFRPSYFPFVEPGAEFDVEWPFGRGAGTGTRTRWLELGGSGMVHPRVLEAVGVDPEVFSGWAFGFGIDRMAMLRHAVPDLRLFFEGDVRFLEQL
jgi:phenylalanyl-tRNA synthetase alpha chain